MASGDRLKIADKPTLDNVNNNLGETEDTGGTTVTGSLMAKANKIIDMSESDSTKMDTIIALLGSGVQEFKEPGTYQFQVSAATTVLTVTACGGGGAGGGSRYQGGAGGGGGGGAAIVDQEFSVTPGEIIEITVGQGGTCPNYNSNGSDGTATVIGNLITLPGGKGGLCGRANTNYPSTGGEAGGTGGGAGGKGAFYSGKASGGEVTSDNGDDGITGKGGNSNTNSASSSTNGSGVGGGGGGSLGDGTDGRNANQLTVGKASKGAGGGGAGSTYLNGTSKESAGDSGGDGYVKLVW